MSNTLNVITAPQTNNKELLRATAIAQLMVELKKGADSVKQESDLVSEEEMLAELSVD